LLGSLLDGPGFLATVAQHRDRLLTAALFRLLAAFTSAAIAVTLYPVLKEQAAGMALGAVAFRLIQGAFYALSAASTLILVSLSGQLTAGASANASADLVRDLRDSAGCVGILAFCTGATLYYLVFYRSQLIPRWLSAWGVAGADRASSVAPIGVQLVKYVLHLLNGTGRPGRRAGCAHRNRCGSGAGRRPWLWPPGRSPERDRGHRCQKDNGQRDVRRHQVLHNALPQLWASVAAVLPCRLGRSARYLRRYGAMDGDGGRRPPGR
jgi:hypothetical protein